MKFKQFIFEKWHKGLAVQPNKFNNFKVKNYINYISHTTNIDGHDVAVTITRTKIGDHKIHNVNFGVTHGGNYEYIKKTIDPKTGTKILNHVHKVINHYIKKSKPKEIWFEGNSDKKRKLYKKYANLLAKQHGANVQHDKEGSIIKFK